MVGVRKIKHYSALVLFLGLLIIALTVRSLLSGSTPRAKQAAQAERWKTASGDLQGSTNILGQDVQSAPDNHNARGEGSIDTSYLSDEDSANVGVKPVHDVKKRVDFNAIYDLKKPYVVKPLPVVKPPADVRKPIDTKNFYDVNKPYEIKKPDARDVNKFNDANKEHGDVNRRGDDTIVQHMDVKQAGEQQNSGEPDSPRDDNEGGEGEGEGEGEIEGGEGRGRRVSEKQHEWVQNSVSRDAQGEWDKMRDSLRQQQQARRAERQKMAPAVDDEQWVVSPPPMEARPLHRTFSLTAISTGNLYGRTNDDTAVLHVTVFCQQDDFTATLTLVNSVVSNSRFPNLTFHFVTPPSDRNKLKGEIDRFSHLKKLAFEVIEFPVDWANGKDMMEFAPFRLPDLLPYTGGRVVVLNPYCLVTGAIEQLAGLPFGSADDWAAMPSLCSSDPDQRVSDERVGQHLNLSHKLVAKLDLAKDQCMPSPAVMVMDMRSLRLQMTRPKLWRWVRLSDESPIFLKSEERGGTLKAAYTVVFHNHTTLIKPEWYVRVSEKSPVPDDGSKLYHWVGSGKPWQHDSPAARLWKKYLLEAAT